MKAHRPNASPSDLSALQAGLALLAGPVPPVLTTLFEQAASSHACSPGEVYEPPSEVPTNISFLLSGTARQYMESSKDGVRRTTYLWLAGDLVARLQHLISGQVSDQGVECLTACRWLRLEYASLFDAQIQHAEGVQQFWRKLQEHYLLKITEVSGVRAQPTAAERFARLHAVRPDLVAAVPQRYLASMIGMSRETYSRLRRP